ncbi:MAG: glycosyltransferase family 4 protein [Candidatus Omnitrophica bacterium]|nr:glycosyltransferase family 4 protein [Candidatus Omnitrophota bacterium]
MKPILLSFYFPRSIEVEGAGALFDSLARVLAAHDFEVTVHAPLDGGRDVPYQIVNYHHQGRLSHNDYLRNLEDLGKSFPSLLVALASPASFAWTRGALREHPNAIYYFGSPLQDLGDIFHPPFSVQYFKHWIAKNRLLARFGKPQVEICLVGTRFQKAQLVKLGVPEDSVHVLPLAISRERIQHLDREEMRREFSLPEGPLVGYLGHFSPIKGVPVLIRAFERALEQRNDLHLAIAWSGKGEESEKVRKMLEKDSIRERVHLTGVVDPYRFLAAMDLVCLPFVHSSFPHMPLVLLESFAVGTPVITSDVGGLSEAVRDGETGWLVPPNSAVRLAHAILGALQNREHLANLGKETQRFIRNEECIEANLNRLLDLL